MNKIGSFWFELWDTLICHLHEDNFLAKLSDKNCSRPEKLTQILFIEHYHARSYIRGPVVLSNRSLTTSTLISADLWCSNSNIKDNHCTVQSQTTPLAVREFVNLQRLSTKTYIPKFPTQVYRGIWGIPIWVINPPIGILRAGISETAVCIFSCRWIKLQSSKWARRWLILYFPI